MKNMEIRNSYGENILTLKQIIALGAAASTVLFFSQKLDSDQKRREEQMESCVSELVDRDVNLVSEPDTGRIQRPAAVYDEVTACLQTQGDPAEAQILLDD